MKDLTQEELIELIKFYKNKSSDIELTYLLLQINNKKETLALNLKNEAYINQLKQENDKITKELVTENGIQQKKLNKEIEKRDKEIQKYKTTLKKS
jgi:hypothetical protein